MFNTTCKQYDKNLIIFIFFPFKNFKAEGKTEHLKKVLQAVIMSKENLQEQIKTNNPPGGSKYSRVAVSRSKNKKTSFRMMLHRETAAMQNQTVNIKADDSDLPLIVTMTQDENPELRAMLNNFYEQEHFHSAQKNESLLEELLKKADYLTPENKNLLKKVHTQV